MTDFFIKIFKALNSAQHPWQVTLSIVLGMVMGLTPMSGTQTLLVLFLVFLLNIHIGLVFASAALFAGLAYLFDPLMEQFGYMLLHLEGMQALYTDWYNNGFMRLSHFNNTLSMGAAVISLLLAVPLFFLLNIIISLYRDKIAKYLNNHKWFSKLGIFKVSEKKEPVLRWWGAGLYVAVVGGVAALLILVIDPLVKMGIEKGASAALKRDVRVASVTTHLLEGSIRIDRLEVAGDEEGVDAFSIQNVGFDLDTNALLLSKRHIENMQLKGIGFDTPATMSKSYGKSAYKEKIAKEKKREAAVEKTESDSSISMPSVNLPTPKELLAKSDLKSQKVYEEAKTSLDALKTKWEKVQKEQLSKDLLNQYKKEFKQMQADAKSKESKKLLALAVKIKNYKAKLEKQKKVLQGLKQEYLKDQKKIETLLLEIRQAPQADYKKLRATYTLDGSGGINLFGLLFSQKVAAYFRQARGYYAQVAPYLDSDDEKAEPTPPRGKGRWIRFRETVPSPDLWIKRTTLSGSRKAFSFTGTVKDISDNQKALGRPLRFSIKSEGERVKGLHLEGEDNRLGREVIDTLIYSAEAVKMKNMDMNKMQIRDARVAVEGKMKLKDGRQVNSETDVAFYDAKISLSDVGGKGAEVLNKTLSEIHDFGAVVTVNGDWESPTIKVRSEIDQLLSKAFKKVMAKEIARYQKELKLLLQKQLDDQLAKLKKETGGFVDLGEQIDIEQLSIASLQEQAKKLLDQNNAKQVAKEKATEYLKDKKNQEKLKKLFKF